MHPRVEGDAPARFRAPVEPIAAIDGSNRWLRQMVWSGAISPRWARRARTTPLKRSVWATMQRRPWAGHEVADAPGLGQAHRQWLFEQQRLARAARRLRRWPRSATGGTAATTASIRGSSIEPAKVVDPGATERGGRALTLGTVAPAERNQLRLRHVLDDVARVAKPVLAGPDEAQAQPRFARSLSDLWSSSALRRSLREG